MIDITCYGRVATEIKLMRSKDNKTIYVNFLIASHSGKAKKRTTTFMRCTAFNGLARLLNEYFSKGDRVILKGRLVSDAYFRGSSGKMKMIVNDFEFVETKSEHQKNINKNGENPKGVHKKNESGDIERVQHPIKQDK